MTGPAARPDPALALSAVEVESLRQMRTRLNRPPVGEAARAVLGKAFLDTVARSGLVAEPPPAGGAAPSPAELAALADAADMGALRRLCGHMAQLRTTDPRLWSLALDAHAPQAIISRRLALAGREPAKESPRP